MCKKIEELDRSNRLEILRQQNRCQGYYDGKQYGKWDDSGEWQELEYNRNEFRPVDNQYKIQVDKLQMEMARSGLDISVEAVDQDSSEMREAAVFLKSRIDANRRRMFTQHPEFVLSENMSLLLKTITFRYTYFDKDAKDSPKEKRPLFAKKTIGADADSYACSACGQPKAEGDLSPCAACGSTEVKQLSTSAIELEVPDGEEEVPCGRVQTAHVDPTMVNLWLGSRGIEGSPFLAYTQTLMRGVVERAHPGKTIPAGKRDDAQRYRAENEGAVGNSAFGNPGGSVETGGSLLNTVKYELIWLDPWMYADYVSKREGGEPLVDGQTLQPGRKLVELFPDGMCVAKVDDTILDLYSEDKNKKWSMCVYGIREHALHGSGTNALIPIQETINDLKSYRLANVYFNTFTREFFNPEYIQGSNLPTMTTACAVTNLPEQGGRIVGQIYDRAPGSPLPPEVPAFQQEQQGSLQEGAGTSSLNLAGTSSEAEGLNTATGIAAMRDLAVGRMGPNLMLKAAMEVEHAYQVAELEQANFSRQHFLSMVAKRAAGEQKSEGNLGYSSEGVEAFLNSDIRADFLISPVPGSWMPSTEQEKKADAVAYSQAVVQVQSQEERAHLAKVFKQPIQLGGWNATEREAARRIEEFAKVVASMVSRGYVEPSDEMASAVLELARTAKLNVEMDAHPAFIAFHLDWWVSDEARTAPDLLKKVVEVRTTEHKDAMRDAAQRDQLRAAQAAVPQKMVEMVGREVDQAQAQDHAEDQQQLAMRDKEHSALVEGVAQGAVPVEAAPAIKQQILAQGVEQPAA
jgi:hypothetical protein